jgi:hypothetical protein
MLKTPLKIVHSKLSPALYWIEDSFGLAVDKKTIKDGYNALAAENEKLAAAKEVAEARSRRLLSTIEKERPALVNLELENEKLTNDYESEQKRADELQGGHLDLIEENDKLAAENEKLKDEIRWLKKGEK